MRNVLVVAPHPDDETLGCGGTLLRHKEEGDRISWLIMTGVHEKHGFSAERVRSRAREIETVAGLYGFDKTFNLAFPTTLLDTLPMGQMIGEVAAVFNDAAPAVVYLPYRGDVHSDHAVTFDVVSACTKWFRYPSVRRILSYEVLSETDFGLNPDSSGFRPNVFVDIAPHLEKKIAIFEHYAGESAAYPFPRSEKALRALAHCRGAASGFGAAEAFMLTRERC